MRRGETRQVTAVVNDHDLLTREAFLFRKIARIGL